MRVHAEADEVIEPRDPRCPFCRLEVRISGLIATYKIRKKIYNHLANVHSTLSLRTRSVTADLMTDEALQEEDIPPL